MSRYGLLFTLHLLWLCYTYYGYAGAASSGLTNSVSPRLYLETASNPKPLTLTLSLTLTLTRTLTLTLTLALTLTRCLEAASATTYP